MSDDAFADIKESIEDGLAFERSERRNLHVTRIQAPGPPKDRMEAIEGISRGLESIKRKAGTPADKFFQEFFAAYSIPDTIRRYLVAAKLLEPVLDDGRFVNNSNRSNRHRLNGAIRN